MTHLNPHLLATIGMGVDGPTDAELLNRFAADRDSGAFELLVWRHASLVLRVCRSILRDRHEAEDAAQAAFLALARQASSIRGANIAGWLFRVARRISMRSARRFRKQPVTIDIDLDQLPASTAIDEPQTQLQRILHEELALLPERYHLPVILCLFEGHTYTEAAYSMGCPIGTVAGRISRAKKLLGARLSQRGISLTCIIVATTVVPPSFAQVTASAAMEFVHGNSSGLPKAVLDLANREVTGLFTMKAIRVLCVLACGVLVLGFGLATEPPNTPAPPTTPAPKPIEAKQQPAAPKPPAPVVEKTFAIAPITTELQRRLISGGGPSSVAMVLVDGSALFRDEKTLDLDAIDLKGIEKGLAAYKSAMQQKVHFLTYYLSSKYHETGQGLLEYGWMGLGRAKGFGTVSWARTYGSLLAWEDRIAPLRENADSTVEEVAVGDDRVRAYPVRTPLSRVLTTTDLFPGKARYSDGVIFVQVKLDPRKDNWLPTEVEKSANAAIAALKLPQGMGKTISFHFWIEFPKSTDQTDSPLQNLCKKWAADNGLEMGYFNCRY
ncbi:MAG TPA: sigma-70 family RNA polymerase sigma factor [Gemmata sp.]|jgi:RNA polymerase sigma factor (sigma-70 family)|nr:sigma-70 family RNA polymerase sigma factor [Gemmata sp.]